MPRKKKSKNSNALAVLAGVVIIAGGIIYTVDMNKTGSAAVKTITKYGESFTIEPVTPVTLTIVSDKSCEACDAKGLETWLKNQVGVLAINRIDYSTREGARILNQYDGTYLPFLLLGAEVEQKPNFAHLTHHTITKVGDRYLIDLEKSGSPIGRYLDVAYYEATDQTAPHIVLPEQEQNLGEIKLSEGVTQAEFTIRNEGQNPLVFFGLNTSCGCTSAKIVTLTGESPVYQMSGHGEPIKWRGELAAGAEGKIVVFYDPTVHPDLTGDVMREVYIKTNDPISPQKTLKILASQNSN